MKVKYANKWYEVAMVQENFGQKWYEIYDEPDTNPEHTDWITHPDEVIEDENTKEEIEQALLFNIYKDTFAYELDKIRINDDGTLQHIHSDKYLSEHPEETNNE